MTSSKNPLNQGKPLLGAWCFLPGAAMAEAYSSVGFDYVAIDAQHGLIDEDMTLRMIQAIDIGSAMPIVRVPRNDGALIGKVLDYGAMGVIVPMIETAEDVRNTVSACRYSPLGKRSYGPTRAGLRYGPRYFEEANSKIAIIPMIETKEALRNLASILSVDGVHAAYVGPYDLSIELGLQPGNNDGVPAFDDAIAHIVHECRKAGVVPAIQADAKTAALRLEQGFAMVTCALDLPTLFGGMRSAFKSAATAARETVTKGEDFRC